MFFIFLKVSPEGSWVPYNAPGTKNKQNAEALIERVKLNNRPYDIKIRWVELET